jgi:hypothetical protein
MEIAMITAVVTFKLPPGMTKEKWLEHNKSVSAMFQRIPGLIRKQFLYNADGTGGGVYLWESRAAAEACYRGPWKDNVAKIAASEPQIAWFETGVVVDNETQKVKVAA